MRRACLFPRKYLFPIAVALATISTYIRFKDLLYVHHQQSPREVRNVTSRVKMKNIVWHQLYHGGLRMDTKGVRMDQCEYSHCQISFIDNKMQEKRQLASADAVVFQGGRLSHHPPPRAHQDQVFIFASVESPLHLHFSKKGQEKAWNNAINWTMTYRTDSDILYKYGDIVQTPIETLALNTKDYSAIFRNKTKMVAWFVSDCHTESLRELYVKKLRQYIDVDVFGQCGTLNTCSKERGTDCLQKVAKDYKFYLSFENSMCRDYMTEKVYSWFNMDIITVVRGARDYSTLLPSNTYIDTGQFQQVASLAQFLQKVGEDERLYSKYLRRKAMYETRTYKEQVQQAYCDLCKRLHNLETYRKSYTNIYKWWKTKSCMRKINDLK